MRSINKPNDCPAGVYSTCISRVRNRDLKTKLQNFLPDVAAASVDYDLFATDMRLHDFPQQGALPDNLTAEDLSKVYTYRMAKGGSPGRPIYDKLMASAPHGLCPICGQRTVSTLDHHLPKSNYSKLTVSPLNLIPACQDCNKVKSDIVPENEAEQTLHPYYDFVDHEKWLFARVEEGAPPAIRYYTSPPDGWDEVLRSRVQYHFDTFKLADLFSAHAAAELANLQLMMNSVFEASGGHGVRDELANRSASYEANHLNSWQAALYKALSESEWYCNGGFQLE